MPPKFRIVVEFCEKLKIKKLNHLGWALPTPINPVLSNATCYPAGSTLAVQRGNPQDRTA
ncbi:MAG: hypothetical protein RMX68_015785 [Aulosira sp. ZfuVER01]|nr:hypothetical protein [Aulosira sp. ZfuVER01]MDZ8002267.1 hypothetical protein [Aulosira sp. DedVER01a]MDZ8052729.1 hypothetical protein [Aulosira sp. ZfuCHP01]